MHHRAHFKLRFFLLPHSRINGLYKAEVIHRPGPWRSFEAVEFATQADGSLKLRLHTFN